MFQSPSCRGRRAPPLHNENSKRKAGSFSPLPVGAGARLSKQTPYLSGCAKRFSPLPVGAGARLAGGAGLCRLRPIGFQSPSCRGRRAPPRRMVAKLGVAGASFSPLPVGAGARLAKMAKPTCRHEPSFSPLPVGAGARLLRTEMFLHDARRFQSPSCRGRRAPHLAPDAVACTVE